MTSTAKFGSLAISIALLPALAYGQSEELECPVDEGLIQEKTVSVNPGAELRFPNHGNLRALIVFVQHKDDFHESCVRFDGYDADGLPILTHEQSPGVLWDYAQYCANRQGDGWNPGDFQSFTDDEDTEWPANWSTGPDRRLPKWAEGDFVPCAPRYVAVELQRRITESILLWAAR